MNLNTDEVTTVVTVDYRKNGTHRFEFNDNNHARWTITNMLENEEILRIDITQKAKT